MDPRKKWFLIGAVFAFIAVISFFQINSYWADQHHFNGGWTVVGILFSIGALYSGYRAVNYK